MHPLIYTYVESSVITLQFQACSEDVYSPPRTEFTDIQSSQMDMTVLSYKDPPRTLEFLEHPDIDLVNLKWPV